MLRMQPPCAVPLAHRVAVSLTECCDLDDQSMLHVLGQISSVLRAWRCAL